MISGAIFEEATLNSTLARALKNSSSLNFPILNPLFFSGFLNLSLVTSVLGEFYKISGKINYLKVGVIESVAAIRLKAFVFRVKVAD